MSKLEHTVPAQAVIAAYEKLGATVQKSETENIEAGYNAYIISFKDIKTPVFVRFNTLAQPKSYRVKSCTDWIEFEWLNWQFKLIVEPDGSDRKRFYLVYKVPQCSEESVEGGDFLSTLDHMHFNLGEMGAYDKTDGQDVRRCVLSLLKML